MPPWLNAALPEIIAMLKTLTMALVMFFGGRWVIEKLENLLRVTLERRKFDPTLARCLWSAHSATTIIIGRSISTPTARLPLRSPKRKCRCRRRFRWSTNTSFRWRPNRGCFN